MKHNAKLMTLFLILLVSLSLQLKVNEIKESNTVNSEKNKKNHIILKKEDKTRIKSNSYQGASNIYKDSTSWNITSQGEINYLTYHTIDCKQENSAINSFQMEESMQPEQVKVSWWTETHTRKQIRYYYSCVTSPSITNNCRDFSTTPNTVAFDTTLSLSFLVRHYLECPAGQVMKKFGFRGKGDFYYGFFAFLRKLEDYPQIWYEYTCCNANIADTKYFETQKTSITNQKYFNLKDQAVNARDFNAISQFNLMFPPNQMFYNVRANVLQGETSPFFPSPCASPTARKDLEKSNANFLVSRRSNVYLPSKIVYLN